MINKNMLKLVDGSFKTKILAYLDYDEAYNGKCLINRLNLDL